MINKQRTQFSRRVIYFAFGLLAIFLGLVIYLIFRPGSYISKIVTQIIGFDMSCRFNNVDAPFLKFYLVDYLWAFSFSCLLRCVFIDAGQGLLCALIVSFTGVSYEILQFFDIVSGTGDIWDCLFYILASWTVNILNIKGEVSMNKNKILSFIMATVLLVVFCVFALGSGESTTNEQGTGAAENAVESTTKLGEYNIEIKTCRLAKDYEGKDVAIITYAFTNNSDDSTAFAYAFDDQVYQNGVGLNQAFFLADSANYADENQTKEIKKGATLDVEVAYELNDITTDLEVEVKELISFNDDMVKKTFTIAQ